MILHSNGPAGEKELSEKIKLSTSHDNFAIETSEEYPKTIYTYKFLIPKKIETLEYESSTVINNEEEMIKFNKEKDMLSREETQTILDLWKNQSLIDDLRKINN
ncbi:MAG: hypothetical protein O6761_06845 [Thaumarchaeota archaeon]|nr:hypothetical protein [Nitrososphaerota archaeon]